MLKRKIDNYIRHYYETTRNALLVTGARQTGKTFSIRQFGKTFKNFVEINFIEMPEAVELFKGAKSSNDILLRLSTITSVPLIKGETLIFFDEVQECPDIVTAIKFLVDDGSYRYILSGYIKHFSPSLKPLSVFTKNFHPVHNTSERGWHLSRYSTEEAFRSL